MATFIGSPSMNLYEASLDTSAEPAAIVLGSQRLTLPPGVLKQNPGLAGYQGAKVIAGIRPEHLTDPAFSASPPGPGASLTVTVEYVEVLGSEQQAHFTIDAPRVREESELRDQLPAGAEQGEIIAASVAEGVARIDPRSRIEARDRAVLGVNVERIHYFDPDSGAAIAPG